MSLLWTLTASPALAQAPAGLTIYDDALQNGWQNYGWTTLNYSNPTPVHSGTASVRVQFGPWEGMFLHHADFNTSAYGAVTFWVNGGPTGGQQIMIRAILGGNFGQPYALPAIAANTWQQVTVPLPSFGAANQPNFDGICLQDATGSSQPALFIDDIALTPAVPLPQLTLTPAAVTAGYKLTTFASHYSYSTPSWAGPGVGPLGIEFTSTGVLISSESGEVRVFPNADGQDASQTAVAQNYSWENAVGLAHLGGKFYMASKGQQNVLQINADGTLNQVVATGIVGPTGIVGNPATGHLFVSTSENHCIYDVDPAAKTATLWLSGLAQPDGIALSNDNKTLYVATENASGDIVGYDTTTKAVVWDYNTLNPGTPIANPDGITLGSGSLTGQLVVNTNLGKVYQINTVSGSAILLASGGSRGDFVAADPAGSELLTQTDSVLRLTPPPGGSFSTLAIKSLTLFPVSVVGGYSSTATVTLTESAPAGGQVLQLSAGGSPSATVPATVTVPAGQLTVTFPVKTTSVSATTTATISAAVNGTSKSAGLQINSPSCIAAPLSGLSVSPAALSVGQSATGTVTLTGLALTGGEVVNLACDTPAALSVPVSVLVPANASSATFTVTALPVTLTTPVVIRASYHGGTSFTQTVTVTPAAGGGSAGTTPGGGPGGLDTGGMTLTPIAIARGFQLHTFATFPSYPAASAVTSSGKVLVGKFYGGSISIMPSDIDGQDGSTAPTTGYTFGLATADGNAIYAGVWSAPVINSLAQDGTVKQSFQISCLDLAVNPINGHIITDGLTDFNPVTSSSRLIGNGNATGGDGVAVTPDGQYVFVAGRPTGYSITTGASVFPPTGFTNIQSGIDGIAAGTGALAGKIYSNNNDGTIVEYDINSGQQVLIASGGTRGDLAKVDQTNGTFLLSQGQFQQNVGNASSLPRLLRLIPPPGSAFGAPAGKIIITRDDSLHRYAPFSIVNPSLSAKTAKSAVFDLVGFSGLLSQGNMQRAGQLAYTNDGTFDVQWGLTSALSAGLSSLSAAQTSVNLAASDPYTYSVNWPVSGNFLAEVQGNLGADYTAFLLDQVSSACGNYNIADQPHQSWPYQKNILTLLISPNSAQVLVPAGRCLDMTAPGSDVPDDNAHWDILFGGAVVGSSGNPQGWDVEADHTLYNGLTVTVPAGAAASPASSPLGGYEVRFLAQQTGETSGSAGFSVAPSDTTSRAAILRPLTLSASGVTGAATVTGTVSLDAPAPAGGATVTLISIDPSTGLASQYANVTPGFVTIPAGQTTIPAFTVTTQTVGTLQHVLIQASYNGYRTASLVLRDTGGAVPGKPSLIASGGNNSVSLSWTAVAGATSYTLLRGTKHGGPYALLFSGATGTQYLDKGVTNGKTYYYVMTASNDYGTSTLSNEASAAPSGGAVAPPSFSSSPTGFTAQSSIQAILSDATPLAVIHYTLDGTAPSVSSPAYSGPITLNATTTVQAYAEKAGYQASTIASQTYAITTHITIQVTPGPACGGVTPTTPLSAADGWSLVQGAGYYGHDYTFSGTAGTTVTLTAHGTDTPPLDTVLFLLDSTGKVLAANDDGPNPPDAQITFTLPATGTYTAEVSTYKPGATGNYTLSLACVAAGAPQLAVLNGTTAQASGSTLAFGSVAVGSSASQTLTLKNTGTAELDLSLLSVPAGFTLAQAPTNPVQPGMSTTLIVSFAPTSAQSFSGPLTLTSNDPASPYTLTLTGTGTSGSTGGAVALASLGLAPDPVIGGLQSVGTITLTSAALAGGFQVNLSSGPPTGATVPASVTVLQGATTATFPIPTTPVSARTDIPVKAVAGGATATGTLTLLPQTVVPLPIISPPSRTFSGVSPLPAVQISDALPGAVIAYTVDGSDPTLSPTRQTYTAALTVTATTTVRAAATAPGYLPSQVASATYTLLLPPSVALTAPITGSQLTAGTPLTVTATASAPSGTVAQVVFYAGSTIIGQAASSPYSIVWPGGAAGQTIILTAVATDSNGLTAASAPVSVTFVAPPAGPALASLSLSPDPVTGGQTVTGTVTLTGAAPFTGAQVAMTTTDAAHAPVLVFITVPAGLTGTTFTIATTSVTAPAAPTIGASYGGATATETLIINPVGTSGGPILSSLQLVPDPVTGGQTVTGTVTLSAPAPVGGASVALTSSDTAQLYSGLPNPAPVVVSQGASTATFTLTTKTVSSPQNVAISASYGGATATGTLVINPGVAAVPLACGQTLSDALTQNDGASLNPAFAGTGTHYARRYTFTPAVSGNYIVLLTTSSFDPALSLISGTGYVILPTGQTVAASGQGVFALTAGIPYAFEVSTGASGQTGAFTLRLTCPQPAGIPSLTISQAAGPLPSGASLAIGSTPVGGTSAQTLTLTNSGAGPLSFSQITVPGGFTLTPAIPATALLPNTSALVTVTFQPAAPGAYSGQLVFGSNDPASPYRLNLTGTGTPSGPALASLRLAPDPVVGGQTVTGTVTLSAAALAGGATVVLTTSDAVRTGLPAGASVFVAAGAISSTFTLTTQAVAALTNVTIGASYGGAAATGILVLGPAGTAGSGVSLSSLSLAPDPVTGGLNVTGTVTLSAAAPVGGATVLLTTSDAVRTGLPVGASVFVAAGATSNTFALTTQVVTSPANVTIGASYGGASATTILTLTPQAQAAAPVISPASGPFAGTVTVSLTDTTPGAAIYVTTDGTNPASSPTRQVYSGSLALSATTTVRAVAFATGYLTSAESSAVFTKISPPSLAVTSGGAAVPNDPPLSGTAFSFGTTAQGVPVSQVFTLSNSSGTDLAVTDLILSGDYQIVGMMPTTVPAGGQATLTVQFNATVLGTALGTVVIKNTSATNPYQFRVSSAATTAAALPTVVSVTPTPVPVTGGSPQTETVTLSGPAPSGGLSVTLASSNAAVASVPASVTFGPGKTTATFTATTVSVSTATPVTLTATLGTSSASATLNVNPSGTPPAITLAVTPPATAVAPGSFTLTPAVTPAAGTTTAKVEFFASGTKIGETTGAAFVWANVPVGSYALTAKVTDSRGISATSSSVPVTVTAPAAGLTVVISPSASGVTFSAATAVTLSAQSGGTAVTGAQIYYTLDGNLWKLYTQPLTLVQTTTVTAKAVATGYANSLPVSSTFNFNLATGSFSVEILSPADSLGQTSAPAISASPLIQAGISAASSWQLSYQLDGDPAWVPFASGTNTAPVSAGTLTTWDTTLLVNGLYLVQLAAVDTSGHSATAQIEVLVQGGQKVGYFTLSYNDLSVPVAGFPLSITRTYDSRVKTPGDFGVGWTLSTNNIRLQKSAGAIGDGWQGVTQGSGFSTGYYIVPTQPHTVSLTFPDGQVYNFAATFDSLGQGSYSPVTGGDILWTEQSGPKGATLTPVGGGNIALVANPRVGPLSLVGSDDAANLTGSFDCNEFVLQTRDGRQFDVVAGSKAQGGGLRSVRDLNGNTLTFTANGITSSSGPAIVFQRTGPNGTYITGISVSVGGQTGPAITYGQDGNGDLKSVTDRASNISTYDYDPTHLLTGLNDPRGLTPLRNYYDGNGRLIYSLDGNNNKISYDYAASLGGGQAANTEATTDRLGNQTLLGYDGYGNVVSTTRYLKKADGTIDHPIRTYAAYADGSNPDKTTQTVDALGRQTDLAYDDQGNLRTVTQYRTKGDPTSAITTTTTYNSFGQPLTVTDPMNHVVSTNNFDAQGNLKWTKDALLRETDFSYNSNGTLQTTKDAKSNVTSYGYADPNDPANVTSVTDAQQHTTSFTYDFDGNRKMQSTTRVNIITSQTEPLLTQFSYDSNDHPTIAVAPDGATSQTFYTSLGKVDYTLDALGRKTTYHYDTLGQMTGVTYPDGTSTATIYDLNGQRIASTDKAGRMSASVYDSLGRVTVSGPASAAGSADGKTLPTWLTDTNNKPLVSTTVYDDAGQVTSSMDALNRVSGTTLYDNLGRTRTSTDALLHTTTYAYDDAGRQLSVTDANLHTSSYDYDDAGRLKVTHYPDKSTSSTEYDELGRRISQTDQASHTTRYEYDTLGRLSKVTDPMNHASYLGYDALGEKTSQTDANGHVTYFAYDNRGRLVSKTLPMTQSDNRTYDALGRLSTMTDFNGKVTALNYDLPTGRLLSKTAYANQAAYKAGTGTGESVILTYNLLDGSRKSATRTAASGTTVTTTYAYYGYDTSGSPTPDFRQGQLKSVTTQTGTGPLLTISYNYDLLGNKIAMQTPSGKTIGYGYDILNRLQTVTHPDNAVTTFGYDKVGNRQSVSRATSTGVIFSTTGYIYDTLNRLTDITNLNGSNGLVSKYHYGLRLDGKRGSVIETGSATNGGTTNYTYDDQGKLTLEAGPYATIAYGYDNVGNRLTRTVTNAATGNGTTLVNGTTNTVFDNNDRITSQARIAGAVSHTYDADGNETTVNGQTASYDFENHLVSLGSTASYIYDADGNRTSVSSASATTSYVVDTSLPYASVIEEYNGTMLSTRYDYGNDLIRVDHGSVASYCLFDGSGSTRQLISAMGQVTDVWSYSAFGELALHTGNTANSFLFDGQQFDLASGNYYLRARYYDQGNGRFLSYDPLDGYDNDPTSLHRYLYTFGDPVNYYDPSGQEGIFTVAAAIGVVSILAYVLGTNYYNHAVEGNLILSEARASQHRFPDITQELKDTIGRLNRASKEHPDWANQAGNIMLNPSTAYQAWDITQLTNQASNEDGVPTDGWIANSASPKISLSEEQERLVIVNGHTFHDYTVNYLIFGAMMRLSGQSIFKLEPAVAYAKLVNRSHGDKAEHPQGKDLTGAADWAGAGYNGWPANGSLDAFEGAGTPGSTLYSLGSSEGSVPGFDVQWKGFCANPTYNGFIVSDGSLQSSPAH